MLAFNVAQLLKEPIGGVRQYKLDDNISSLDPGVHTLLPLKGQVKLLHTNKGILAEGQASTAIQMACGRCLDPIVLPVDIAIEEEFEPIIDILTGYRRQVEEEDPALIIDEHHILDLSEVVRQATLLATPMHPLCREDCAGLCPECGQNLNEGHCDCHTEVLDPRWTVLKNLRVE